MSPEEKKLWILYKKTKRPELYEQLVSKYLSLVHYLANKLNMYTSNLLELDDLYSAGLVGLLEAIERFDIDRGYEFSTFGTLRIKGAIIDEIRKTDWVPRSIREKHKKIKAAIKYLYNSSGHTPSDSEIAQEMDITIEQYNQITDNLGPMFLSSLDENISSKGDGENLTLKDVVSDDTADVQKQIHKEKVKAILLEGIDQLSDREKLVISLYYYEELSLKEIGKILEVSESRVCQIHSSSILKLKNIVKQKLNDEIVV